MTDLPDLYFRVRDKGATVFRMGSDTHNRRIEMEQIAVINTARGDYKVTGDSILTPAEEAVIADWIKDRLTLLAARDMDQINRTVEDLNLAAHWAQSKATDDQLEAVTDPLLLAMHDLRAVLVRKKADRLGAGGDD